MVVQHLPTMVKSLQLAVKTHAHKHSLFLIRWAPTCFNRALKVGESLSGSFPQALTTEVASGFISRRAATRL